MERQRKIEKDGENDIMSQQAICAEQNSRKGFGTERERNQTQTPCHYTNMIITIGLDLKLIRDDEG